LSRHGWTGPATLISIETSKAESVAVKGFAVEAERTYGIARITLLRAEG
jgi:16S rRNA (guanine966-N2)-methyltransferase